MSIQSLLSSVRDKNPLEKWANDFNFTFKEVYTSVGKIEVEFRSARVWIMESNNKNQQRCWACISNFEGKPEVANNEYNKSFSTVVEALEYVEEELLIQATLIPR